MFKQNPFKFLLLFTFILFPKIINAQLTKTYPDTIYNSNGFTEIRNVIGHDKMDDTIVLCNGYLAKITTKQGQTHIVNIGLTDFKKIYYLDINGDGLTDILTDKMNYYHPFEYQYHYKCALRRPDGSYINEEVRFQNEIDILEFNDFNKDNLMDITARSWNYGVLYKNNGDLTFSVDSYLKMNEKPYWVKKEILKDFDNDGELDLLMYGGEPKAILTSAFSFAYINYSRNGELLKTDNHRVFATFRYETTDLEVLDINEDGFLDIIAVCPAFDSINFYINNGNRTFTKENAINTIHGIHSIEIIDINKDGKKDLAYYSLYESGWISDFIDKENRVVHCINFEDTKIRLDDVNNDGQIDWILHETSHIDYLDDIENNQIKEYLTNSDNKINNIEKTDLENNGKSDFIYTTGKDIILTRHVDENSTEQLTIYNEFDTVLTVASIYLDSDTLKDILALTNNGKKLFLFTNNGEKNFNAPEEIGNFPDKTFNKLYVDEENNILLIGENGIYSYDIENKNTTVEYGTNYEVIDIVSADLNNDGINERIITLYQEKMFSDLIYLEAFDIDGNLVYKISSTWESREKPISVLGLEDFNNDGLLDILFGGRYLYILKNISAFNFEKHFLMSESNEYGPFFITESNSGKKIVACLTNFSASINGQSMVDRRLSFFSVSPVNFEVEPIEEIILFRNNLSGDVFDDNILADQIFQLWKNENEKNLEFYLKNNYSISFYSLSKDLNLENFTKKIFYENELNKPVPQSIEWLGDITWDGYSDIVFFADSNLYFLENKENGIDDIPKILLDSIYVSGSVILFFDVDNKNGVDIYLRNWDTGEKYLFLNNGSDGFQKISSFEIPAYQTLKKTDINKDGYPDFIGINLYEREIKKIINNKDLTFSISKEKISSSSIFDFDILDFNNDGYEDIAYTVSANDTIFIYVNDKSGSFEFAKQFEAESYYFYVRDYDNDGWDEIISEGYAYENDDKGEFLKGNYINKYPSVTPNFTDRDGLDYYVTTENNSILKYELQQNAPPIIQDLPDFVGYRDYEYSYNLESYIIDENKENLSFLLKEQENYLLYPSWAEIENYGNIELYIGKGAQLGRHTMQLTVKDVFNEETQVNFDIIITEDTPTSSIVKEQTERTHFSVNPVPCTSFLNIAISNTKENFDIVSLELYTLSGFKICEYNEVKIPYSIPVNIYPPGIYLLKIVAKDKTYIEKFIKE